MLKPLSTNFTPEKSLLCTQWVAKDPRFLHADSEDSDQTGRMPRLNWVLAGRTLILSVLSRGGSIVQSFTVYLAKKLLVWT